MRSSLLAQIFWEIRNEFSWSQPRLRSECSLKTARDIQCGSYSQAWRACQASHMFRWALVCAALSALAACDASGSSQTTPADSVGSSATQSATVTVTNAAPAVSISANPSTVKSGATSSLTWSSTNATACTATGGWTGSLATSGSKATGALTAPTTYTLSCTGSGGSATHTATVTVTAAGPDTATLSWVAPSTNTDGTAVTTLTGYTIYYGTGAGPLTQSVIVSGASTVIYEITSLASGTWYFAVAADAADGTQSAMSDLGSKTI